MATRKEQLTATEFARRRVLGALLRPGSANPDEGVPRPFRALVAAVLVAVVALGVASFVGYSRPGDKKDAWQKGVIADDSGAQYVMVGGRLHPVLNMTSARLLLGPTPAVATPRNSELSPYLRNVGAAVGISHVPTALPKPSELDLKDWSACVTPAGKTVTDIGFPAASGSGVLSGADALLVQDDSGQQWVVDGGMKYKVGDRATVAAAFGMAAVKARRVPTAWLGGMSAGDMLGVPSISGKFGAVLTRPAPAGFNRVGMFGKVPGAGVGTQGSVAEYYIVTGDGLAAVSTTMYQLYERDPRLLQFKFTETVVPAGKVTADMLVSQPASQTLAWPAEPPRFSAAFQDPATVLCATFAGSFDQQGRAHMTVFEGPALPSGPPHGDAAVVVRSGHGVIVRESGSDPATATVYLVTDTGLRYELVGAAAARLGYDGIAASEIPAEWLRLVPSGPALDPSKAAQSIQ